MTRDEFFQEYPDTVFYDFEVFKAYWLLVIIDKDNPDGLYIETIPALRAAFDARKDYVWIGYNSKAYDRFIFGALYRSNITKADLYQLSQHLIGCKPEDRPWHLIMSDMKGYDAASFDMAGGRPKYSLKQLEAFMGHSIDESTIPWDYPEPFNADQKEETRRYCYHDVSETFEVLLRSISDFQAQADIISTFNLGVRAWSMTKAQLTAEVLQCNKTITEIIEYDGVPYTTEVDLDFSGEEWSNFVIPCVCIQKYTDVLDFFLDSDNYKDGEKLNTQIMGVPHIFGLGGIHGARKQYHQAGGQMMHIDVRSYYPSLMIEWDLLTRRTQHPEFFKEIYDKRIQLKAEGKKREQQPYKIILNSTFGITNDQYSKGYDPCRNHEVCINGQLLYVMLLERLEGHCDLIQSNTDGIFVSYAGYDRDEMLRICKEWEAETRLVLEYDEVDEIWQKDVNNYLVRFSTGKYDAKGGYLKYDSDLDRDLPIIREAVRQGLIKGSEEAVREAITGCHDLVAFQKIFKLSGKYKNAYLGDQLIENHKCFRLFAVTDGEMLRKQKADGGTREKVANVPEKATIVYGDLADPDLKDVTGKAFTLDRLDLDYYIDRALKQYHEMLGE